MLWTIARKMPSKKTMLWMNIPTKISDVWWMPRACCTCMVSSSIIPMSSLAEDSNSPIQMPMNRVEVEVALASNGVREVTYTQHNGYDSYGLHVIRYRYSSG